MIDKTLYNTLWFLFHNHSNQTWLPQSIYLRYLFHLKKKHVFSHGFLDFPMSFPMDFLEISHVFPVFSHGFLRFGHGHGGYGHGAKECISLRCPLGRDTPSATPWPWRIATLGSTSTGCFLFRNGFEMVEVYPIGSMYGEKWGDFHGISTYFNNVNHNP